MRNILLYVFMMLLTAYIEVMYDNSRAITFLAFEILTAAVMLGIVIYLRRHIKVGLESQIPVVHKGEDMEISVRVKNSGKLPVSRIILWMAYENEYSGVRAKEPVYLSVSANSEASVVYRASAHYCGKVDFYFVKGRVWDYLGLFSRKLKCDAEVQINVLPNIYEMHVEVSERTRNFLAEGEEYKQNQSGDDPAEILDVREFRDGDTLQRVHWKLSAKNDDLMTKEFSSPIGCNVLLLLELSHKTGIAYGMKRMDAFMEVTASLLFSLCQAKVFFCAAWYDEEYGRILRQFVRKEEDVYEVIDRVLSTPCYKQAYDLREGYTVRYPGRGFSTVLMLDTDLRLMKNEEEIIVFAGEELYRQIESEILIV